LGRRKTTEEKQLKGTLRPDRANAKRPVSTAPLPRVPSHLSKNAKKEWKRLAKELASIGVLTSLDSTMLERHCEALAEWRELTAQIQSSGWLIRDHNGMVRKNPLVLVRRGVADELHRTSLELGLAPISREKLTVEEEPPVEEADAFDLFSIPTARQVAAAAKH
jgi:P27 family predicted phage terminase small subunit